LKDFKLSGDKNLDFAHTSSDAGGAYTSSDAGGEDCDFFDIENINNIDIDNDNINMMMIVMMIWAMI